MSNAMTDHELDQDREKARQIEWDIQQGTKRTYADLGWYIGWKWQGFDHRRMWRHKETETVYEVRDLSLAATGKGTLALMVRYTPEGMASPPFERQYELFVEKFEPVRPTTVWERL